MRQRAVGVPFDVLGCPCGHVRETVGWRTWQKKEKKMGPSVGLFFP